MKHKFYHITNKSFAELGVATHKELWDKVKGEYSGLSAGIQTEFVKAAGDDENKFHVIMSTATEDRHGDIVMQDWDLKSFKKNPVFLDSHNYGSIEHIIGKFVKIAVVDGKLQGDVEFCLDNPKGLLAYKMAKGGFLNATSVGFIPKLFNDKGNIVESELLEDSAVSVPANAEALFEKSVDASERIKEAIADVELPKPAEEEVAEVQENPEELPVETAIEEKSLTLLERVSIIARGKSDRQKTVLSSVLDTLSKDDEHSRGKRKRMLYQSLREML